MNRAEILADLKVMIGNGVEVSDGELYNWINDGYFQLVDAIISINPNYFAKTGTFSTTTSTNEYDLASDFEKLLMVSILYDGKNYRHLPVDGVGFDPNVLDNNTYTLSNPRYYLIGTKIGLLPAPGEAGSSNGTYWYTYTPAGLTTDASSPAIPARYHHLIKYWAYAVYLDRDDEHVSAERMRQRFDVMVDKMTENMFGTQIDQPKGVEIVNNVDMF